MANGANGCANVSNECVNDANGCANEFANESLALSLAQMGNGVIVERGSGFDPRGRFQCTSFSIGPSLGQCGKTLLKLRAISRSIQNTHEIIC